MNDLLALILVCAVSLLFIQSDTHVRDTFILKCGGDCIAPVAKEKSKSNSSQPESNVDAWIRNVAVLNSTDPVFQIRNDFRVLLQQSINQIVTIKNSYWNRPIDDYNSSSQGNFSISIFHCQLVI